MVVTSEALGNDKNYWGIMICDTGGPQLDFTDFT